MDKEMKISLLTGGSDKTYASGLLLSLIEKGIEVDFIGSDELHDENILNRDNRGWLGLYRFSGLVVHLVWLDPKSLL